MSSSKLNHSPWSVRDWRMKPVMGGCWASGWNHCKTTPAELWFADSVAGGLSLLLLGGGSEAGGIKEEERPLIDETAMKWWKTWEGWGWVQQTHNALVSGQLVTVDCLSGAASSLNSLYCLSYKLRLKYCWVIMYRRLIGTFLALNEKCVTHYSAGSWNWCYFFLPDIQQQVSSSKVFLCSFRSLTDVCSLPGIIKRFQGQNQHLTSTGPSTDLAWHAGCGRRLNATKCAVYPAALEETLDINIRFTPCKDLIILKRLQTSSVC